MNGSGSIGGNDPCSGTVSGYLVSASIHPARTSRTAQVRALADRAAPRVETVEIDRFTGRPASQGVLWGGLANLSTLVGERIARSLQRDVQPVGRQRLARRDGRVRDDALPVKITRMQYVERSVHSAQLAGEHQIADAQRLDWAVTLERRAPVSSPTARSSCR